MGSTLVLFTAAYSWHADNGHKINMQKKKILARVNEKGGERQRREREGDLGNESMPHHVVFNFSLFCD